MIIICTHLGLNAASHVTYGDETFSSNQTLSPFKCFANCNHYSFEVVGNEQSIFLQINDCN